MSIVNLLWSCSSQKFELIVRRNADGEEYAEKLYHEGEHRFITIQHTSLLDFVQLGLACDWQPEGALLMDIKTWVYRPLEPGMNVVDSYNPAKLAEFKLVLKSDAAAWADALERARAGLEDGGLEFTFERIPIVFREQMTHLQFARVNVPTDLKRMREFIDFLRKGPFEFYYDD